jgi:para-aminobenzoate synthetase component 1
MAHAVEIHAIEAVDVFKAFSMRAHCLFLDSANSSHPMGRYSYVMADPVSFLTAKNGIITQDSAEAQRTISCDDPFLFLQDHLKTFKTASLSDHNLPPFTGGAAGFFGYDLGRALEKIPETALDNPAMPDMAIGIYDQVFAYDHLQKKGWFISHKEDFDAAYEEFLNQLAAKPIIKPYAGFHPQWQSNFSQAAYEAQVQRVIDYILAGDIFQANLSQKFESPLTPDFDIASYYLRLRAINPAPFGGYFDAGTIKLCSASPERFLQVHANGSVETCPIKGTRPHGKNEAEDMKIKDELLANQKERAENTMIVDLLRNDLSRTCTPDSVIVTALCELQSFASVHHLVSSIEGELQNNKTAIDLLRDCFPGGSITGAPKIRAMEIIEELEPNRRGAYCGAMGFIGFNGVMDTNILIRTVIFEANRMSFQVGGGIVADSNLAEEYQETLDKAAAIFRSFLPV